MRLEKILLDHCERTPDKIALVCGDRSLSFGDLGRSIRSVANGLLARGVGSGDRVVLYLPNGIELVEALFACFAVGAMAVPVTTRLTFKELAYFCDDSAARIVVCDSEQAEGVAEIVAARPALGGVETGPARPGLEAFDALRGPDAPLPAIALENDEGMVMYTSGTTGRPKGVVLTHANILIQHGFMNGVEWRIGADDRYLVVTPMAHRSGLGRLMNATMLGGTLYIFRTFDADRVVDTIDAAGVTVFGMVPTVCRMIMPALEKAPERCRSLKRIVVTGEAFPVPLKERLIELLPWVELVSFFGMTEAGCVTNLSQTEQFTHPSSVGRAAPGVEVRVADPETGEERATGDVGELLVRCGRPGAFTIMKEYLNRPEATAEALRDGWFHTGDMATRDEDGYLYIVDRKKDMILSGGFNIYSKEVELVIAAIPGVIDVAVVGVPDPIYGEAVAAFVEIEDGADGPSPEAIIAHCRETIASYKKPKFVFYRNELPRNAVGKILKQDLATLARQELEARGDLTARDAPARAAVSGGAA
ncbi:class I adenylate-forming enzyme family protein [Amorphus coralli]|uniref:class I adenylate-forming enzyme family protein n=1 Tax=Amorphus coralli TaxID=340680 RepID=UPI000377CFEF|nr:class I adenylate-forming enzyme family protein [Amorphus coralli]